MSTNNGKRILEKRLLDIDGLSHYISLSPQTIRNRLCSGTFPVKPLKSFGKKLLWDKRDIDQYINKSKQKGCCLKAKNLSSL